MDSATLPPLTGSAVLDPWRIRYRRQVAGELDKPLDAPSRQPTNSERSLWSRLQGEPQGWQMEVPTRYGCVLDFYCESAQLAVEVDGEYHRDPKVARRDNWRDEMHATIGIKTERFSARDVERDPDWVVTRVRELVERRLRLPAHAELPVVPVDEPALWTWAGQLRAACVDVLPTVPSQPGLPARLSWS